jgi:DNA-binding NtrC family response regulator
MGEGEFQDLEVLVVDDERIAGRAVKLALRRPGFAVEVFEDPELAIKRLDERPFDIVVTDIVMGDVDGIQVLEHALRKSPETKVIIITAFAMRDMARKAMEKGAFDFIAKPFNAAEIREVVIRAARAILEARAGS